MSKVNILIVDDRPDGLFSIQAVLNHPDYNLVTASSGPEALKHLLNQDFAVILLDVQMPVMNGFETAAMIKTREASKDIPIIFMSAINQDEQYVYQGYRAGAVDYLLKPFDPYILRSKVGIFVDIYRKKIIIQEQARKLYENELQAYAQALDKLELESLRRYQHLADSIPQIVFQLKPEGSYQYLNRVWYITTGQTLEQSMARGWLNAIHPDERHEFKSLKPEIKSGFEFEARVLREDGQYLWHLFRFEPEIISESPTVVSWIGAATDIQDRKQMEDANRYLAKAGELLVSSLDYESTLKNIANLAIPQLADWCSIDVMKDNVWQNVTVAHVNPAKLDQAKEFREKYLSNSDLTHDTSSIIDNRSAMIVPMSIKGKAYGTLTFVFSESGRRYNKTYVKVAEEIARRCALAYENSRLYKLAQESIEVRNDFISIASHELNTPITSLKLYLQLTKKQLGKDQLDVDRFTKSVDASLNQVDHLIDLVDVLLDISRIQAGKLDFHFEKFNLIDLINDVRERTNELVSKSKCSLAVAVPSDLKVKWDKMRIGQVVINLINNAIKYAPGDIEITVLPEKNVIKIIIKDFGNGIPQEKLTAIFERFQRATSDRSVSGLGLGLFIVKQIVEGHGGDVSVISEPKKGSSFIVSLPYDSSEVIQDL